MKISRSGRGVPVCVISSCYEPENLGGVGILVDEERRGLERLGYDVHMIGPGERAREEPGTTRVPGHKKFFPWTAAAAYLRARRQRRFEIVHGHEFSGTYVALLARLERWLTGRGPRVVTTMQCSFLQESRTLRPFRDGRLTRREWVDKWLDFPFRYLEGVLGARLSDRTIGVSAASAREIGRDYLGARRGVPVVPNGVDVDRFHPGVDGTAVRRAWDVGDAPLILFAGRFVGRKGVEYLLEAFARVAPRHPSARLVLVGEGRRDYGPWIRQLGLGSRVLVRPGEAHRRMPELYAAADIFCLPSLYEGLPLAILEAMASGTAVVSTRTDGIPDAIRDGESGLLVPPQMVVPLADALDRLLGDADLRRRLGAEARRVACEKFAWERAWEAYGDVFREVRGER